MLIFKNYKNYKQFEWCSSSSLESETLPAQFLVTQSVLLRRRQKHEHHSILDRLARAPAMQSETLSSFEHVSSANSRIHMSHEARAWPRGQEA